MLLILLYWFSVFHSTVSHTQLPRWPWSMPKFFTIPSARLMDSTPSNILCHRQP